MFLILFVVSTATFAWADDKPLPNSKPVADNNNYFTIDFSYFKVDPVPKPERVINNVTHLPQFAQSRASSRYQTYNYLKPLFRKFPHIAQKGVLTELYFPLTGKISARYIRVSRKSYRLAASFRIYSARGTIMQYRNLKLPQTVAYIAPNGIVKKVWLLSEEEIDNFEEHKHKPANRKGYLYR